MDSHFASPTPTTRVVAYVSALLVDSFPFLPLAFSMSFAFIIISHFMRNGFTVDDLGLLIAVVAVLILITRLIYRAAVGPPHFSKAARPLTCIPQCVLAYMIIPAAYRDALFPPVSAVFGRWATPEVMSLHRTPPRREVWPSQLAKSPQVMFPVR